MLRQRPVRAYKGEHAHFSLLYCHTLCQISRLINIEALRHRYIITHQLQRDHRKRYRKVRIRLRNIDHEVCRIFNIIIAIGRHRHQVSPTAFTLDQIADRLLVELRLSQHTDHQRAILNQ